MLRGLPAGLVCLGSVCLGPLGGCRSEVPESPPEAPASPPPEDPSADEEEPSLLDDVAMLPAQRRYSKTLLRNFRRDFAPYDDCRARLVREIVVEVRRGQTDRAVLDPLIEECVVIYEELVPVMMKFMDDLHAMLSTAQRKRVVALAYGEEPDEELSEQEQIRQEQSGLLDRLKLSTGQKARMFPPLLGVYFRYMGPIGDLRRSMKEAKEAFISDDFSAQELRFFREVEWRPLGEAIFEAGDILLGVLDPAQREELARFIEQRWG